MRLNFFAKLVILVLSLTLASTGITGFILLNGMEANQKSAINSQVQRQAAGLNENIEAMLQDKIKIGQMIAGHPQVVRGDATGITELLTSVDNADSASYEFVALTNKEGQITNIVPSDTESKMIGVSLGDRPYFKDAMQSGKPVIGDIVTSRNSGKPVFVVAVPVKDGAGHFSGVVAQVITLDALEKLRAQIKIGETGFASVVTNVNGKAITIAHQDKTFVAEQKDMADVPIVRETMKGQKQLMSFKSASGVNMIGATEIVPSTNWIVTAMVPEAEVYAPIISSRYKMLCIIGVAMLVVIFLTWYFARRIASRLTAMLQRVTQVAKGDLQAAEMADRSNDEIGQLGTAINGMTENLRNAIRQVAQSAEQVAASSEQLKAGAEQSAEGAGQVAASITEVAAGTEKQTIAVGQTAAAVDEISVRIKQAADTAQNVEITSDKASAAAKDGGKAVDAAVSQMNIIENKVAHSAQVVVKLGERSKEIGQIIDTIAGIAGQTNLLALNAAIEAARAGEQGRGFAVVAEEVRKLAEQSQEATKHIAELIGEIQQDTDSAVVAMNEGSSEVKIGSDVVNTAGRNFTEIALLVNKVSEQVKEISGAIQGIAGSSREIVGAVQQIDGISKDTAGLTQTVSAVTEEQSASMQEIAASSNSLAQMAQTLQQVVAKFRV